MIGVPPGARVTLAPATTTTVVLVGIAITVVVLAFTKVSETAPDGGAGFGSVESMKRKVK